MIVEEQRGGDARAWNVTKTKPVGADREHVGEVARRLAFSHEPVHPPAVKERKVLRLADGYLVIGTGPMAKCHFRVTLGHRVVTP
ncbi:hypothetical protein [Amycolatopsis mediterranei]|uniref:hypothetical protein n=1 Tax=Amycolatopsis mediterranei TaxID=33910 RepID=UPI001F17DC70|nr:hypothetical protein [Amycolatopsis mediterranei]